MDRLRFWTKITLVWLMIVTVSGAAVRLTGSGLGCTDWPDCTVNNELDSPGFHSAIEFGNRIISGLAIIPVIGAWLAARKVRPDLLKWIWLVVAGFIGQVVLGMLVTRTELDPRLVLGHFLLSILLIFWAAVLHYSALQDRAVDDQMPSTTIGRETISSRMLAVHGWVLVGLTTIVIVIGTLVTGSGPHTGTDDTGDAVPRLGFAIRDITRVHSIAVWVLAAALVWGLWQVRNSESFHRSWLLGLTIGATAQGAIGYLQYFTGVPVLLVGLHIAAAVVLWTGVVFYALHASAVGSRVPSAMAVAS